MSSLVKCKFCDPGTENFSILRSCLPEDYEYIVCSLSDNNPNFKTRLRTNGKNQEDAHKWLEDFQMYSKCTMRVERTYPHSGTKNVFKIDLRCQHNTRPRNEKVREKESCKNTDCPAKMGITIKRVVTERKSRSKDPHLPDYPTVIQMDFCHNHAIMTPEILKHRSVLPEVKDKILGLFKLGHNPSTALDMHKYDLLLEYGENFEKIAHDRAILPDSQFCYRLFYKIIRKQTADSENTDSPAPQQHSDVHKSPLSTNCENSSARHSGEVAKKAAKKTTKRKLEGTALDKSETSKRLSAEMCKFCGAGGVAGMLKMEEGRHSALALCTPLMLRAHRHLRHSGDLVFVDTYGELDDEPDSCRVHLLSTYSSIGAVPLGCLVTTAATPACIGAALDLWKQSLPASGRFFDGGEGPALFLVSDESEAERQALRSSFPGSRLLTCLSHMLQSSWTFLQDRKNAVKREHRSLFFSKIKMLLYSQTVQELEMNYAYAIGDDLVKSNAVFLDHLNRIYDRRQDWSLAFCRHLLPRTGDFSLFWESAMIVLRDPILSRARTFNPLQVIDFLSRLDTYYERRLIDLANDRLDSVRLSRFLFVELPREAYTITQFSDLEYEVHNDAKDTTYQVDVSLGVCECRTGKNGSPCKHQLLVFRNFPVPVYDCVPPSSPADRDNLFLLATGHTSIGEPDARTTPVVYPTEIVVDPCDESSFFLEDGPAIDSLSQSVASNPLTLPQQQDPVLPSHNLLSQLDDPRPLSSNSEQPLCAPESVSQIVDRICDLLKQRASGSPSTFRPALRTFLRNAEGLSSDSSLEYALYSFGRFSKSATPLFRRKIADNRLVGLQSAGELKRKRQILKRSKKQL